MKYKNGFTLTELLATIVILAVISLIATPAVIGVSNSIKNNMFESKKKLILQAAKLYAEDNPESTSLQIKDLCDKKYLSKDEDNMCAKNPKNNTSMDNCTINISKPNGRISLSLDSSCN